MNSNQGIFLKLSPKWEKLRNKEEYYFYSNKNNKIYKTTNIFHLYDPAIDATFKYIFQYERMYILEDMLNSLLFPDSPQLSVEAILDKEISWPNQIYDRGIIKSDLVCKAKLNGEEIIFGIEMQIGIDDNFTKRLFQFSIGLSFKYECGNSWINEFFIYNNKQSKHSKSINIIENENGEEKQLD